MKLFIKKIKNNSQIIYIKNLTDIETKEIDLENRTVFSKCVYKNNLVYLDSEGYLRCYDIVEGNFLFEFKVNSAFPTHGRRFLADMIIWVKR